MADTNNVVLFLGSGTTAGSGIKRESKPLPADSGFFNEEDADKSKVVKKLLNKGGYPALELVKRKILKGNNDTSKSDNQSHINNGPFNSDNQSLFKTWNNLFIFRGLYNAGLLRAGDDVIEEFLSLANHEWPRGYGFQKRHYQCQFEIMQSQPIEYYLLELAIWDMRVLVKDVYGKNKDKNVYGTFWNDLKQKGVSAVINLNYDTTFDDSLKGKFYYPGDGNSSKNKTPLIRPHGSLKWSSTGKYSRHEKKWEGWTEAFEDTKLKNMGYKEKNSNFELRQPLIVPPASFKEEVVGNSSMPGLQNWILRLQWSEMSKILRRSKHWIFVGVSFASGDDHLLALMKKNFKDQKICFSSYDKDEKLCHKIIENFGDNICRHDILKDKQIDSFLNNKCKNGLKKGKKKAT